MSRLPVYVSVASVVPFVALSVALSMHGFQHVKPVAHVLLTYAAVIISFLGGIHWGLAITQYAKNWRIANLLIAESIAPAIIAWGAIFYTDIHMQFLVMTVLYTFMWAIDSLLYNRNIIPQWFFNLRGIVTPIVVVSLYVAYFGMV